MLSWVAALSAVGCEHHPHLMCMHGSMSLGQQAAGSMSHTGGSLHTAQQQSVPLAQVDAQFTDHQSTTCSAAAAGPPS